ncbi:MAG TPA: ECF-type sigma factor [Candidatus Limnocylindria bacterium]|jgi:RNA polymerase sigma factor (TIGR02999 family)|nr:ECF-type sigma factor [Candidatus Limnocylindria bacterium]
MTQVLLAAEPLRKNPDETTQLLVAVDQGRPQAAEALLDLVYQELRQMAASKMAREAPGHTLQATALVHEAWLRLVSAEGRHFENRAHFFAAAAQAMRRILIDHARKRNTKRRGSSPESVEFDDRLVASLASPESDEQLLAVDDALERLHSKNPLLAKVVNLRYFAGMTNEEIAELMGISVSSVKNYWTFARAWLRNEVAP